MVLGLLAVAAIPTATGVANSVSAKDQTRSPHSEEQRMQKFNLQCFCTPNTPSARRINKGRIILRQSKLYIVPRNEKIHGHLFEGFYIAYPDSHRVQPTPMGLVSTISNEPPILNWIYVDKRTRELKYGNRTQSREHVVGSWDWDVSDEDDPGGLVLEGEEAAVAVRSSADSWEIRWADEDGAVHAAGKELVEVSLERKMLVPNEEKKKIQSNMTDLQRTGQLPMDKSSVRKSKENTEPGTAGSTQVGKHKRTRRKKERLT